MPDAITVYRISLKKFLTDLSGVGAKLYGGRWNSIGNAMMYTSVHPSNAILEFVCNTNSLLAPKNVGMAVLTLPPHTKLSMVNKNELPANWDTYPSPDHLKNIGDRWLKENKTLALKVPSAIMHLEENILLNPMHKDYRLIQFNPINDFKFDHRLTQ